jgi:dihydropteroate synthase
LFYDDHNFGTAVGFSDDPSGSPLPRIMGIVSVTPDSFSDGGQFLATDAAVDERCSSWLTADVLDIGGNPRPGAQQWRLEEN